TIRRPPGSTLFPYTTLFRSLESELVGHILDAVAVVVDQNLIQDVVSELEEVRASRRLLERDEVREDRALRGVDRVDERVQVRVVGHRSLRNRRRLAMRRHRRSPRVCRETVDESAISRHDFLGTPHPDDAPLGRVLHIRHDRGVHISRRRASLDVLRYFQNRRRRCHCADGRRSHRRLLQKTPPGHLRFLLFGHSIPLRPECERGPPAPSPSGRTASKDISTCVTSPVTNGWDLAIHGRNESTATECRGGDSNPGPSDAPGAPRSGYGRTL